MFNTVDDFLKFYKLDQLKPISLEEMKNTLVVGKDEENYEQYLINSKFDDYRSQNYEEWLKDIHEFFFVDPVGVATLWWNAHCAVSDDILKHVYFTPKVTLENNIIRGMGQSKASRISKNLFFDEIYKQTNTTNTSRDTLLNYFFDILINKKLQHNFYPYHIPIIKEKRYSGFFAIMRGITSKASIFNAFAYYHIIATKLPLGKKIYCPVASWCTPVIAYHNLHGYDHMVVGDVIPNVLSTMSKLNDYLNDNKGMFFEKKKLSTYCCPTEQLREKYNFDEKYKDYFDTVFFCPPYYNLEIYPSPENNQSTDTFDTYENWLKGYWEETCKLCHETLKQGGTFSFVITPEYERKGKHIRISKDMLDIAKQYFEFTKTELISWGGFKIDNTGDKRRECIEHIHILKKTT